MVRMMSSRVRLRMSSALKKKRTMPIPESIQRIYTKVELRSIELEKKQEEANKSSICFLHSLS